jgi:AraC-like DNA-binding protein
MVDQSRCRIVSFEGFEQLREVVPGTRREIVQVESGHLSGSLLHAQIGSLPIDAVTFNLGVHSRGEYPQGRVTIGILLASGDVRCGYDKDRSVGDVTITPSGLEQANTYCGPTSIFVTSLPIAHIQRIYERESWVESLNSRRRTLIRGSANARSHIVPRLSSILGRLKRNDFAVSEGGSSYYERAILDALMFDIASTDIGKRDGSVLSARNIVNRAEDFIRAQGHRPVHVSELCQIAEVSRRTLHRAFNDIIGLGPIEYLRFKRLCAIHSILLMDASPVQTIQDLALDFGFLNSGRLAKYYRSHFGEFPANTRAVSRKN